MTSQQIQTAAVLVVGGGDTAAEYVQYLPQQDNRITLSYRKADFTRLNQQNHDAPLEMEQRGEVEILRNSNIKEIEDEAGRPRIRFAEPEHAARTLDRVIFALGGTTPTNFLHTLGITFNGDGPVFDDPFPFGIDFITTYWLLAEAGNVYVGPRLRKSNHD